MVDFHSHILPLVDHGSSSVENSILMLEAAKNVGINTVVATPHFYPDSDNIEAFLEKRQNSYDLLMRSLPHSNFPKVVLGAEVYYSQALVNNTDVKKLCINGTNFILLEMPYTFWTASMYSDIFKISSYNNIFPVIAHIERYPFSNIKKLLNFDVYTQINAGSVSSFFTYGKLKRLIKNGNVHLIGSDCHGDALSYKNFATAVKKLKHLKYTVNVADILNDNAIKILNNKLI